MLSCTTQVHSAPWAFGPILGRRAMFVVLVFASFAKRGRDPKIAATDLDAGVKQKKGP